MSTRHRGGSVSRTGQLYCCVGICRRVRLCYYAITFDRNRLCLTGLLRLEWWLTLLGTRGANGHLINNMEREVVETEKDEVVAADCVDLCDLADSAVAATARASLLSRVELLEAEILGLVEKKGSVVEHSVQPNRLALPKEEIHNFVQTSLVRRKATEISTWGLRSRRNCIYIYIRNVSSTKEKACS